MLYIIQYC